MKIRVWHWSHFYTVIYLLLKIKASYWKEMKVFGYFYLWTIIEFCLSESLVLSYRCRICFTRSVDRCTLPELNSVTRPNVHWSVFRNHISISRKEGLDKETYADLSERGKVGVLWTLVSGRIRRRWIGGQPVQLSQIRIYYSVNHGFYWWLQSIFWLV